MEMIEFWWRTRFIQRAQEKGLLMDLSDLLPPEGLYPQPSFALFTDEFAENSFSQPVLIDPKNRILSEVQQLTSQIRILDKEISRLKIKLRHRKMGLSGDLPLN